MADPRFEPLGDRALLLRWDECVDIAVNRRVHALAGKLNGLRPPWLVDCVPAYASLAVFFDDAALDGDDPMTTVRDRLSSILAEPESSAETAEARLVEIPVCYGGEHGPDLDDVASACGLSAAQVVELHARSDYLVAMLGFSPGFPYLLGLDPALAVSRLATPRTLVPAGSVGIGGAQTGIYPNAGPGGWRLIGRTPQSLFDVRRNVPALLLPGDRVRFVPIEGAQYAELRGNDA